MSLFFALIGRDRISLFDLFWVSGFAKALDDERYWLSALIFIGGLVLTVTLYRHAKEYDRGSGE